MINEYVYEVRFNESVDTQSFDSFIEAKEYAEKNIDKIPFVVEIELAYDDINGIPEKTGNDQIVWAYDDSRTFQPTVKLVDEALNEDAFSDLDEPISAYDTMGDIVITSDRVYVEGLEEDFNTDKLIEDLVGDEYISGNPWWEDGCYYLFKLGYCVIPTSEVQSLLDNFDNYANGRKYGKAVGKTSKDLVINPTTAWGPGETEIDIEGVDPDYAADPDEEDLVPVTESTNESIDYKKIQEEMEEHEDNVECVWCMDIVNKKDAVKDATHGYICKNCLPEVEKTGVRINPVEEDN